MVLVPTAPPHLGKKNKAGYTATPVTCRWAGAVLEKVTRESGQELKNAEKVKGGPKKVKRELTDQPTNQRT